MLNFTKKMADMTSRQASTPKRRSLALLLPVIAFAAAAINACNNGLPVNVAEDFPDYNFVIGTQTIAGRYRFTDDPVLVETAKRIREMGSNTIKIMLGATDNEPDLDSWRESMPCALASGNPIFKQVLDMDFTYYLMWVTVPGVNWTDGMSAEEKETEYKEINKLAEYLLTEYKGTGKKFYIGHWEGDWLLLGDYDNTREHIDDVRIKGMTDWYNTRQKAVEDARKKVQSGASVYQYLEVNRVRPAMDKGYDRIINRVLPNVDVDYVSYSAWESTAEGTTNGSNYQTLKKELTASLNDIESKMKPKPSIPGRRVFIGEYGYPLPLVNSSPKDQARRALNTIRVGMEWGCPFILYWEFYDNEGDDKGYWMINSHNEKQPVYHVHEQFYTEMKAFIGKFAGKNGRTPTDEEYRTEALSVLVNLYKANSLVN